VPSMTKAHDTTSVYVESVTTTGTEMYLPSSGEGLFRLLHCEMYTDCPYATQVFVAYRFKDTKGSWKSNILFSGYIDAVATYSLERERELVGPFQLFCYLPSINTTTYNVTLKAEWRRIDVPLVQPSSAWRWW